MNFAHNLEISAYFFPNRPAVRQANSEMICAQLNERANRVVTSLIEMVAKPGMHIGLCAPNSSDWIVFHYGDLKAGAVAVTLSALLTRNELQKLLNHPRERFIFAGAQSWKSWKIWRDRESWKT